MEAEELLKSPFVRRHKLKLAIVAVSLVVLVVFFGRVGTGALLAQDGAAVLSSFYVVTAIFGFIASLSTFVLSGSLILVGSEDGQKKFKNVGRLVVWSLLLGLTLGCIVATIVISTSSWFISIFDTTQELLNSTEASLTAFAASYPSLIYNFGLSGSLVHLLTLKSVGIGLVSAGLVFAIISYPLYFAGIGIASFGYGFISGSLFFSITMTILLFGNTSRRQKYHFTVWRYETGNINLGKRYQALKRLAVEFLDSNGMLFIRSFLIGFMYVLTLVLVVRIGVVEAAIFAIMANLRGFIDLVSTVCVFPIYFLGSRIYGAALAQEPRSDFTALFAIARFSLAYTMFFGILMAIIYGSLGSEIITSQANIEEKEEYVATVTPTLFAIFCLEQLCDPLASIAEAILLTTKEFNYVGVSVIIAFGACFLPTAFIGYNMNSLTLIYLAELVFNLCRIVLAFSKWVFVSRPRLLKRKKTIVRRLSTEEISNSLYYLCCCNGKYEWRAIIDALEDRFRHHHHDEETSSHGTTDRSDIIEDSHSAAVDLREPIALH